MGKIVMPKNSALLSEVEAVLKIYYDENDWLANDIYKERLKKMIGDEQYSSSYTKKAQITSYFGFTIWEDINNPRSKRKITDSGKRMYKAIESNNRELIIELLVQAIESVKFGRDNYGCPDSNSDIEPPSLFIRAVLDLEYLTHSEFAFLLWRLEDCGGNYTDAVNELKEMRSNENFSLDESASKYADCKPIMVLERWGLLEEDTSSGPGKHITIPSNILQKYERRLKSLKVYNIDMDYENHIIDSDNKGKRSKGAINKGENILYYGVPGAGKSHIIDNEIGNAKYERVVFHPDYTYSDFVGQIMPKLKEDGTGEEKLSYEFVPGPFTKALDAAINNPEEMFYLVIEEINRGNAPAVFGDVFQLLDRNEDGSGKYHITNFDIAREVYGDETEVVKLPSNLSIYATMNTSDQNVFTLDTAFQRRWHMKYVRNDISKAIHAKDYIDHSGITWEHFATTINKEIVEYNAAISSSEDKQLGAYFAKKNELNKDVFPEKVLKYLWDDAFKLDREQIFETKIKSIGMLIGEYHLAIERHEDPLKSVMRAEVYKRMLEKKDAQVNENETENNTSESE